VQVEPGYDGVAIQGLSPSDVVNAISAQNLILAPAGTRDGQFEYNVDMNASPQPSGAEQPSRKNCWDFDIYIHDVANVRDGFPPQTNIVRVDGQRASLLTLSKPGTSRPWFISGIKQLIPQIVSGLPKICESLSLDQSLS